MSTFRKWWPDLMVPLALAFHTLGAIIWVGGMFFAHMALRPAAADLAPPERLALWRRVLPRFFFWVWISIGTLLVTGYGVLFIGYGGMAGVGMHIHIMQATGLLMMALYAFLYAFPYQGFRRAVDAGDMAGAAAHLAKVRQIIVINMPLGLFTSAIGGTGGYWG